MTVESNNAIATDTPGDLKNLATLFQPMTTKTKTKTNCTPYARFFPRFELQVIAMHSDWFIPPFAPVVIGWSKVITLVLVFWQSFENHSKALLTIACQLRESLQTIVPNRANLATVRKRFKRQDSILPFKSFCPVNSTGWQPLLYRSSQFVPWESWEEADRAIENSLRVDRE